MAISGIWQPIKSFSQFARPKKVELPSNVDNRNLLVSVLLANTQKAKAVKIMEHCMIESNTSRQRCSVRFCENPQHWTECEKPQRRIVLINHSLNHICVSYK